MSTDSATASRTVDAPVEVDTEREQRARTLEAAALEIEVRGWTRGAYCCAIEGGAVCAVGAIGFAAGLTAPDSFAAMGSIDDAAGHAFGRYLSLMDFNDSRARDAADVTFVLRWRAEEIRD